jgi:hypothetical protein
MTGNDRQPWRRRSTLDFIEFGVAYAARGDPDQDLLRSRYRPWNVDELQRFRIVVKRSNFLEGHCAHG